jgi:hypothetical protein
MISVLVLHAQRGPNLPSARPAQPHLAQVAWAVQMRHGRIEVNERKLVERSWNAQEHMCKTQLDVQLCANHDGVRLQTKACANVPRAIQVLAGRRSAMACITSAKPPGTRFPRGRSRRLSFTSTMPLDMRRRCSANTLLGSGYNAGRRPPSHHAAVLNCGNTTHKLSIFAVSSQLSPARRSPTRRLRLPKSQFKSYHVNYIRFITYIRCEDATLALQNAAQDRSVSLTSPVLQDIEPLSGRI